MKNLFKVIIILIFFINNLFALNKIENSSYINTKNVTYNEIDNTIELGKDSLINISDTNILTDKGIVDYDNDQIEIFGNFYIYQGQSIISAENLKGNVNLTKFKTNKVSYIYDNDLKVDSQLMERNENEVYFYDNFITPCELEGYFNCPTWSLKIPKTLYLIEQDQFIHYDSFLQIADKKIFYLPYLSHYGTKADRKKGFLAPKLDYNLLNGGAELITPYYMPINISTDLTLTPKIELSSKNLEFSENFEINSTISNISKGGITDLNLRTKIYQNQSNFYNSIDFKTNQTINKNNNIEINALLTNSISESRANNEDQINYASTFIRANTFNFYKKNDLLITEINTVTSFDETENNLTPYHIPYIKYRNKIDLKNNFYIFNYFDFFILERSDSSNKNASKNIGINFSSELFENTFIKNNLITNKIIIENSFRDLTYDNNENNKQYTQTNIRLSTDLETNIYKNNLKTKIKFIMNEDFDSFKNNTNEDSHSNTFNYQHMFKENRFYGYDLNDNSKRIVYGLEIQKNIFKKNFELKISQGYDFSSNNEYLKKINQFGKISDYAYEAGISLQDVLFKIDGRVNHENFTKKEMNYSANYNSNQVEINLVYNETSKDAFASYSDDSKALKAGLGYFLNNNIKVTAYTSLDIKNDYSPFENQLKISLFDECSQFDLSYVNTKFSDNFTTSPKETISLSFMMDYLGFFGYEQQTDLFFKRTGTFYNGVTQQTY